MKSAGGFVSVSGYLDLDLRYDREFRSDHRDNSVPTYVNNSFAHTGQ